MPARHHSERKWSARSAFSESMALASVIILTKNEETNLPLCLASLKTLDCEIVVVDSGSTDCTTEIARNHGARVVEHAFENQARQFNWALESLSLSAPWIIRLDADERLTPELGSELSATLLSASAEVTGFLIKRRVYFWGRWIRHGGYYPIWLLRVWRQGCGRYEDVEMDEHVLLKRGRTVRLQNDIIDDNHKGLTFWIDKHNTYSDREVQAIVHARHLQPTGAEIVRRRYLKVQLYGSMPLFVRAMFYWMYRYFILLGFLDGLPGLVFHFLQGFWYRFVVDAKLYELRRQEMRK
jgi:glycosyltransferase involved in cell wall biosynthesis